MLFLRPPRFLNRTAFRLATWTPGPTSLLLRILPSRTDEVQSQIIFMIQAICYICCKCCRLQNTILVARGLTSGFLFQDRNTFARLSPNTMDFKLSEKSVLLQIQSGENTAKCIPSRVAEKICTIAEGWQPGLAATRWICAS